MRPVNADMMKRVRGTAKWSQLYKTGPSIPPKNKASFLNNDDEDEEEDNQETKGDINGTYRNDFEQDDATRVPFDVTRPVTNERSPEI